MQIDFAEQVICRNVIFDAELVEQRPLRDFPRPHHPLDPSFLGSIESPPNQFFKAELFNIG